MTAQIILAAAALAVLGIIILFLAICFRTVVPTNFVHIVQSAKHTVSYGKIQGQEPDAASGNVYYKWPSWVPKVGVTTIALPMSVFDVSLNGYAAYDKGRVPFVVDVMAFFRITESNVAAQRVESFPELEQQLQSILQGAIRTILASSEIEEILEGRSKFGDMFTKEVDGQLKQWGVQTVKLIELMDIRDAQGSQVIANIMAKKKSAIEMQSRTEVAENMKKAQVAEIDAEREVQMQKQDALQKIGTRTAEQEQAVGIAAELAQQEIKEQARVTAEKLMAVQQVEQVRAAEITRQVQVVAAEQEKVTSVVRAEGQRQQTILIAEGNLQGTKLAAEGIQVEGAAKGAAEQAILMAPVNAQIALAQEIGENQGYQTYLVSVRQIEANQVVGVEQAKALQDAEIKVIANAGGPVEGVQTVMDLLTAKGGTQLGAMFEAFRQTPVGEKLMRVVAQDNTPPAAA